MTLFSFFHPPYIFCIFSDLELLRFFFKIQEWGRKVCNIYT